MQRNQETKIQQVENNLHSLIELEGEKGKNIFDRMRKLKIRDVSIAVFNDGQIWSRTYSISDDGRTNVSAESAVFQAASISKTINAVLAMKLLVNSGKMSLDEDVNLHLKGWKITSDVYKEKITLRRLLSHTAGLSVSGFPGYPSTSKDFPTILEILHGSSVLTNLSMDEREKLIKTMPDGTVRTPPVEIIFEPGSKMEYSGGGTTVVQKLIEDIVGAPFASLAKKYILDPLGMTSSTFEYIVPTQAPATFKKAFDADGKPIEGGWMVYPELAAAGLWTTTTDLAKFYIAVQQAFCGESNLLLSPEIARQMLTRQTNSVCGLGFFVFDYSGEIAFGHSGGNQGYNCEVVTLPNKQGGVVVMTNSDQGFRLINELMCSVFETYQWPGKPYTQKQSVILDADSLANCCGEFIITRDKDTAKVTVSAENGKLIFTFPYPHFTSTTTQRVEVLAESKASFFSLDDGVEFKFSDDYKILSFGSMKAVRNQPEVKNSNIPSMG